MAIFMTIHLSLCLLISLIIACLEMQFHSLQTLLPFLSIFSHILVRRENSQLCPYFFISYSASFTDLKIFILDAYIFMQPIIFKVQDPLLYTNTGTFWNLFSSLLMQL
jgi:hypothetical protein